MRKLRIYLDTSVISGCCDPEFSRWSNRLMDDFLTGTHSAVISDIVQAEIGKAPDNVVAVYVRLLQAAPEVIVTTPEAVRLADAYVASKALAPRMIGDARHVALATIAGADVLASWNFRHIVGFSKVRMFNAVNAEQGYGAIMIHSPREVATNED